MVAIASATGAAIHTPFSLNIGGSNNKAGIKNITCLDRLKNIDIFAFTNSLK